jgi:hypothetical protein
LHGARIKPKPLRDFARLRFGRAPSEQSGFAFLIDREGRLIDLEQDLWSQIVFGDIRHIVFGVA